MGGNHFRLIAWVVHSREIEAGRWARGKIYVRRVLPHAEYDKGKWTGDCEG